MEVEKFVPKRVQKDIALDAVSEGGERLFLPGDAVLIKNGRYYKSGKRFVLRNLKGNTIRITNEQEGQVFKVIGCVLNEKYSTFIYFLFNGAGNHRIVEYNPLSQTQQTLVSGSVLGFEVDKMIDQVGCIDDLVIWNPRIKPIGKISLPIARAAGYAGVTDYRQISLHSTPPTSSPSPERGSDVTRSLNRIEGDNWQFSYNFIYKDNSETVLSPYSILIEGKLNVAVTGGDNKVDVTVSVDPLLVPFIKIIQLAVRKNNDSEWFFFDKIINPTLTSYSRPFYGTEALIPVPSALSVKLQDDIPLLTDALAIIRNRIFSPLTSTGFDVSQTFTFGVTVGEETAAEEDDIFVTDVRYFKDGSTHAFGIVVYNEYNQPSFVQQEKYLSFDIEAPVVKDIGSFIFYGADPTKRKFVNWSLSGNFDPKFKKFQIVMTKDSNAVYYQQFLASPYRYVRELAEGETDNSYPFNGETDDNDKFSYRGKVFFIRNATVGTVIESKSLYLQMPLNPAFVPSSGDIVRITDLMSSDRFEFPILQIVGDYIDLGKDPIEVLDPASFGYQFFIEVYRPGVGQDRFYEISEVFDINNGVPSVTSGRLNGDTFFIRQDYTKGTNVHSYDSASGGGLQKPIPRGNSVIESPVNVKSLTGAQQITVNTAFGVQTIQRAAFSFDYGRISSDYGRVHTTSPIEKNYNYPNTFGFSDPYVQDSNINGLSSFAAANKYSIPIDRTKVTALKTVGDVLIAMHERNVSSLYVGEGFIKQGADFILAKTDSVVGDDRKLVGGYGCIHPESMMVAFDQMYFWDANNGCVCRYTNAGTNDISRGMSRYFYNKSRQLAPYYGQYKVVSSFDYAHKEFIITWTPVTDENGFIIIPGETWIFDLLEEFWTYSADYIPECYGTSQMQNLAFLKGNVWEQETNELHNNFFGIQYQRTWRFVMNKNVSKRRTPLNIHIKGPITTDPLSEDIVVRAYTPDGQETYIPAYEFEFDEGKWKAAFLKDIHTQILPENSLPLRSGTDLEDFYIEVEVINNRTDEAPCSHVNTFFKYQEYSI
jgi:hypothetical protein